MNVSTIKKNPIKEEKANAYTKEKKFTIQQSYVIRTVFFRILNEFGESCICVNQFYFNFRYYLNTLHKLKHFIYYFSKNNIQPVSGKWNMSLYEREE